MQKTGKPLSELKQGIRLFPQTLLNLKVRERKDLEELDSYQKALKKCRDGLKKGRIFVRYSGTEPKLRILVESESSVTNERIANQLKEALIEDLGQ
jgi:phosphoglucosamine mutase